MKTKTHRKTQSRISALGLQRTLSAAWRMLLNRSEPAACSQDLDECKIATRSTTPDR